MKKVLLFCCLFISAVAVAGEEEPKAPQPPEKIEKVDEEFRGEFSLSAEINMDGTTKPFKEAKKFATIKEDSVILPDGTEPEITGIIRTPKNKTRTNAIVFTDSDEYWIIGRGEGESYVIVVVEGKKSDKMTIYKAERTVIKEKKE
ncbi:MAG: hypothetical protein JXR97_11730 [Planctomycetes bacterium]|nr:hypothetical protein [Planctomycetota bacterium]